jgi:glyoxylase-like metal-dependent hydrolase (beta-lactamase superfamily II)
MGSYKVFGTTAGRLENTLAAADIKPDDIDAIILTHGHIDHLSGILREGKHQASKRNSVVGPLDVRSRESARRYNVWRW